VANPVANFRSLPGVTGVPYRQDNFFGAHGIIDGTIEALAVALLAPILGWFEEGFDTADLHAARTCSMN
jgi:hypothetical protein